MASQCMELDLADPDLCRVLLKSVWIMQKEYSIMPKSAYRRLTDVQRDQIAQRAAKRFGDGLSAGDFCRQAGVHYSTLKHIC